MKPTLDLQLAVKEAKLEHFHPEAYNLAVTGSRRGMTAEQIIAFAAFLSNSLPSRLLHGCCAGSDEHADKCYRLMLRVVHRDHHEGEMTFWKDHVWGFPPTDQSLMMAVDVSATKLAKPKPYLIRNKNMVNNADALVAFPDSPIEIQHSGTWIIVRYAAHRGTPTLIILPSGAFTTYPLDLR